MVANTYTFGSFTNCLAYLTLHWNTLSNLWDSKLDIYANTSTDNELAYLHIPSRVAKMPSSPYKVKVQATRSTLAYARFSRSIPKIKASCMSTAKKCTLIQHVAFNQTGNLQTRELVSCYPPGILIWILLHSAMGNWRACTNLHGVKLKHHCRQVDLLIHHTSNQSDTVTNPC